MPGTGTVMKTDTINITALRHSAFYTPLLYTLRSGLPEQNGLEVYYRPVQTGESVADLLQSGEFHLSQSAVAASFAGLESGEQSEVIHFAAINDRDGFFLVGREEDASFDWHKLTGREVLVDHLFQPLAMFRYVLHEYAVPESGIGVIDAGSVDDMVTAFVGGQGDYIHLQGPAAQQLEHDGIGRIVASLGEVIGPVAFSSLCATRQWLQTGMANSFMVAYRQGCREVIGKPADELAEVVAADFPEIDFEVLTQTIAAYQRMGCWPGDSVIRKGSYQRLLDIFEYNGLVSRRYPYDELVASG